MAPISKARPAICEPWRLHNEPCRFALLPVDMMNSPPASARQRPSSDPLTQAGQGAVIPVLLLAGLLFFPPALPFLLNVSSFLIGTIILCLGLLFAYVAGIIPVRRTEAFTEMAAFGGALIAFVIVHLTICSLVGPVALFRALQTLPILGVFLLSVPVVVAAIFERDKHAIDRAVLIVLAGYALSGVLSIIELQPPGFYGEKPTFPFTEPSFLAFTIAPVLIYFCVTHSFVWRWAAVAAVIGFAVVVSNLTTVATALLVILTFARWWQIGGAVAAGYLVWPYVDQDYFIERLTLSVETTNLTALVYQQGWQMLDESLRVTSGWGRGLQQLGAGYTNTIASYRINQIMGGDVNLLDGGFLLAKTGSEFGVLGLGAIAALTVFAGFALLRLRAFARGKQDYPRPVVLAYSSVVGSMVEIYLRGSTYFTGTILLLSAAIFYLINTRQPRGGATDRHRAMPGR